MGVTNRNKITYRPTVSSSTAASSSESLHIPSLSSSEHDLHHIARVNPSFTGLSRTLEPRGVVGRRRAHRLRSILDLEKLGTISEEDHEDLINPSIQQRESPFCRILNDSQFAAVWETFCRSSETEQDAILNSTCTHIHFHADHKTLGQNHIDVFNEELGCNNDPAIRTSLNAYRSLTYTTRRRLRKIRNLLSLTLMEEMILEHFFQNKQNFLEKNDLNDHLNFLCSALAQYYNLTTSLLNTEENVPILRLMSLINKPYIHCPEKLCVFLKNRRQ